MIEITGFPAVGQLVILRRGSDGYNRHSVPYSVSGAAIRVEAQGASIGMACPPEVTAQADAFMDALSRARGCRAPEAVA